MSEPRIELCVLGSTTLRRGERNLDAFLAGSKRLGLLTYLAVARPRGFQRRDALLPLFWPGRGQKHGRNALSNMLYHIRQELGADAVTNRGTEDVALNRDVFFCDAIAFEEALDQGREETALDLYRGEFLAGFHIPDAAPAFDHWLSREREHLHRMYQRAVESLATTAEARGAPAEAAAWWRRKAEIDPGDSRTVRHLMEALVVAGNRTAALQAGLAHTRHLEDEFGVPPHEEIREFIDTLQGPTDVRLPHWGEGPRRLSPTSVPKEAPLSSPPAARSIAVLPLEPLGSEEAASYAQGLHGDLVARLSTASRLRVLSRTSVRDVAPEHQRKLGAEPRWQPAEHAAPTNIPGARVAPCLPLGRSGAPKRIGPSLLRPLFISSDPEVPMIHTTNDASPPYPALRNSLRGRLLTPGETGYDEARALWNGLIDKHPDVIVQCAGPADVMTTVEFARAHDRPLSVKGGGHMTTGHAVCDEGIMVDLSPMNGVRVNPTAKTVRAQGGATWDQVNHETLPFHLLPPGIPLDVGVGGFTLGGGMGVVARKHGLAVDSLREVDVVTASGELVTADPEQHPDLFWAVRGGGGNFGVVTSFQFDCFEEPPECLTGQLIYSLDDAAAVLRHVRETMSDLPDALFPVLSLISIPEMPGVPEALVGQPGLFVYVMCVGPPEEVAAPLDAFVSFGDPVLSVTDTVPYSRLYDPFKIPKGQRHHWESAYLDDLSDAFIDDFLEEAVPLPTPTTAVSIYGLGGAIRRVAPDATAYAHRAHPYLFHVTTHWTDPADDARCRTWTRRVHEAVRAHGPGGEYINNQTEHTPGQVRAAFGEHYDRLATIKATWDPENLFRENHNVEPAR